jgi:hypothetical protein
LLFICTPQRSSASTSAGRVQDTNWPVCWFIRSDPTFRLPTSVIVHAKEIPCVIRLLKSPVNRFIERSRAAAASDGDSGRRRRILIYGGEYFDPWATSTQPPGNRWPCAAYRGDAYECDRGRDHARQRAESNRAGRYDPHRDCQPAIEDERHLSTFLRP